MRWAFSIVLWASCVNGHPGSYWTVAKDYLLMIRNVVYPCVNFHLFLCNKTPAIWQLEHTLFWLAILWVLWFFWCLVLTNTLSHLAAWLDEGIAQDILTAWKLVLAVSQAPLPLCSFILKEDNHSWGHKGEEASRPLKQRITNHMTPLLPHSVWSTQVPVPPKS